MLVIAVGHCGSCGDLNFRQIQTKNRLVCENAVTGTWGSHMQAPSDVLLLTLASQLPDVCLVSQSVSRLAGRAGQ